MGKSQGSLEMILMTGIVFIVVLIGFFYFIDNDSSSEVKIEETTKTLSNSVSKITTLGTGNRQTVNVNIPQSISSVEISGSTLTFTSGDETYTEEFSANIVGYNFTQNGSINPGSYDIIVEPFDDAVCFYTEGNRVQYCGCYFSPLEGPDFSQLPDYGDDTIVCEVDGSIEDCNVLPLFGNITSLSASCDDSRNEVNFTEVRYYIYNGTDTTYLGNVTSADESGFYNLTGIEYQINSSNQSVIASCQSTCNVNRSETYSEANTTETVGLLSLEISDCRNLTYPNSIYRMSNGFSGISGTSCLNVSADNIIIDGMGFNFSGGMYFIYSLNSLNITTRNFNMTGMEYPIFYSNTNNSQIYNNTINESEYGIRALSFHDSVIENNTVVEGDATGGAIGIYVNGNNVTIRNNLVANITASGLAPLSSTGLSLQGVTNSLIENNWIGQVTVPTSAANYAYGVSATSNENNTFKNNSIFGNVVLIANAIGFTLSGGSNNYFSNNSFELTYGLYEGTGLSLYSTDNNTFENNSYVKNLRSIYLRGSSNNIFRNGLIDMSFLNSTSSTSRLAIQIEYIPSIGPDYFSQNNQFINVAIWNRSFQHYDFFTESNSNGTEFIETTILNYSIEEPILFSVENQTFGKVEFLEGVNGSGYQFHSEIYIQNNSITISNGTNSDFSAASNVTLYGMDSWDFSNPGIKRDGANCGAHVCSNLTPLNAATVIFNVTAEGVYSIGESGGKG